MEEIKIGDQIWMTRNLDVENFQNGDSIPCIETKEQWMEAEKNEQPAWCYYENDPANGEKYGKIYNWYAVNDERGLAPKGWHIPLVKEWEQLSEYLGESSAGIEMKNSSGWYSIMFPEENYNGTNNSGFSALPGGERSRVGTLVGETGRFNGIGNMGSFWSSTESNDRAAHSIKLLGSDAELNMYKQHKGNGLYVRCIKD